MKKRPLCITALVWVAVVWLLGKVGVPGFGHGSPDFPDGEARESALVAGTVYKSELNEKQTVLYLKQTILIKQANLTAVQQEYPFDRIKVRIKNQKSGVNIGVGDRVLVRGDLEEIPIPGNPGQFHERAYYYARKVKWYQKGRSIQVLEKEYDAILGFQEKIKKALGIGLHKAFSKEKAGIMEAMLLGSKENMEKEINFLFQILGCSHILAVSGLHLSVLGGGLFRLLRKCSVPLWGAAGISAFSMFFYGGVTGNGASVLRASIMFAVYMGSFILKRTYDLLSAVSFAAILLLCESPCYLYDSSFLLSFGAVLGIGVVYPGLFGKETGKRSKQGKKEVLFRLFREGFRSGISVWFVILPLILYFFFQIPLWGSVASVFFLPLSPVLLISGAAAGIGGRFLAADIGRILGLPASGILEILLGIGEFMKALPGALWTAGQPEIECCIFYYAAAIWFLWRRGGYTAKIVYGIALAFLLIPCPKGGLEVTFLDVGQGDCACVQTEEGHCYLIDGGSTTVSKVGRYRILPFLKASGIGKIQGIFVSHMDADHVNGIKELLEMTVSKESGIKIERLFLSQCSETAEQNRELETLGKKAGCEVVYIKKGSRIKDRDLEICCIGPGQIYENSNESSQVLHVSRKGFDILFTGDVEGMGEEKVLEELREMNVTWEVLKVAHHGSANSTGEEFLQYVKPEKAVISCGKENSYGHPHKELLKRLKKYSGQILFTKEQGAVHIIVRNPAFSGK